MFQESSPSPMEVKPVDLDQSQSSEIVEQKYDEAASESDIKFEPEDRRQDWLLEKMETKDCDVDTMPAPILEGSVAVEQNTEDTKEEAFDEILICDAEDELNFHSQTSSTRTLTFQCDECDFRTNKQTYLGQHKQDVHLATGNFPCPDCKQVFSQRHKMMQHLLTFHRHTSHAPEAQGDLSGYCDICNMQFVDIKRHQLWRHERLKLCQQEFYGKLRRGHIPPPHRAPKERKHPCTMCSRRFRRPSDLRDHMTRVHRREPRK